MTLLTRFSDDPLGAVLYLAALLLSLSLHEFGHAWAAVSQGDDTPRQEGRLSLNPLRHLDPIGTLLIVLIGFGWARPVMTRPDRYRQPVWGEVLVSSAGIVMNLALAVLGGLALRGLGASYGAEGFSLPEGAPLWLTRFLVDLVGLNVLLAVFNALPVPPLDGSHLLAALVPGPVGRSLRYWANRSSYLLLIVLVLLREPVSAILGAARRAAFGLLL